MINISAVTGDNVNPLKPMNLELNPESGSYRVTEGLGVMGWQIDWCSTFLSQADWVEFCVQQSAM
jgi:hypothetical protein